MWRLTWITFKPPQYRTNYELIQFKKQNISAGIDHQLHDGLDNEGERGHGHEDWDEGAEELHKGDGGGVPQQDYLRLPECHKEALYNSLDYQRTGTKGLVSSLWFVFNMLLAIFWMIQFCRLEFVESSNLDFDLETFAGLVGERGRLSRGDLGGMQPCWEDRSHVRGTDDLRWHAGEIGTNVSSHHLFQGDLLGICECNKLAHGRYHGLHRGEGLWNLNQSWGFFSPSNIFAFFSTQVPVCEPVTSQKCAATSYTRCQEVIIDNHCFFRRRKSFYFLLQRSALPSLPIPTFQYFYSPSFWFWSFWST